MPGRDKRETCVAKDDISDFVTSNLILFKKRNYYSFKDSNIIDTNSYLVY